MSCFCLVLCVLFAMLWVRSSDYVDSIEARSSKTAVSIKSWIGGVRFRLIIWPKKHFVSNRGFWVSMPTGDSTFPPRRYDMKYERSREGTRLYEVLVPDWFLVVLTGLIAFFAKPKPRFRFGIRELFALSTVGAITVGTFAAVLRALSH